MFRRRTSSSGKIHYRINIDLYIQIYDLFSDHVAESKGTGWLPSFRASPALPPPPVIFGFSLSYL